MNSQESEPLLSNDRGVHEPVIVNKFRFWTCLHRAIKLVCRNWFTFLFICTALYGLPNIYLELVENLTFGVWLAKIGRTFPGSTLLFFPNYFLGVVADALIAVIVFAQLTNTPLGLTNAIGQVRKVCTPLLFFSFIDLIAVDLCKMFLFIPLVIYGAFFWMTVQSMSVESLGMVAAMRRSLELTNGNRIRYSGIILTVIMLWALNRMVSYFLLNFTWYEVQKLLHFDPVGILLDGFLGVFIATLLATAYHDMRSAMEDTPRQRMVEAFE